MAERKVNMDQRRTENTMSTNRQSDLEKEYKNEFMDGKRVDAIEKIEEKQRKILKTQKLSTDDQLKAYRLACYIFEVLVFFLCTSWNLRQVIYYYYCPYSQAPGLLRNMLFWKLQVNHELVEPFCHVSCATDVQGVYVPNEQKRVIFLANWNLNGNFFSSKECC